MTKTPAFRDSLPRRRRTAVLTGAVTLAGAFCLLTVGAVRPAQAAPKSVEALVYSTMPSTFAHSPAMAMDGNLKSYFRSYYGMGEGDTLRIQLSEAIPIDSIRVTTGDDENQDTLTNGVVEVSEDGVRFTKAAAFNAEGVAEAELNRTPVIAVRIRVNSRQSVPALVVREITLRSPVKIAHVQAGPGRGFADLTEAPDLADWARRAENQMEAFWPDMDALLYSDKFITPNMVHIVYKTGPGVTAVAATGGGVMTVNSQWCRTHAGDTGLTVHEVAHVVQSMSAYNPVWLIEGIADYLRWIKFEPENYTPRIDIAKATYKDSYRTTGTFLAWCELHYDSRLVTKLNNAVRFGHYDSGLFAKFCGKDVDTLWAEFIAAYKADPAGIITPLVPMADRPRTLPTVKAGSSVSVDLTKQFDTIGFYKDGAAFGETGGFDAGGAAYSGALLGNSVTDHGTTFTLGQAGSPNSVASNENVIALPSGIFGSLWLLGAAIEGNQGAQTFTVLYTDGSTETLYQNVSDWYQPQRFPGESRAVRMPYRLLASGARDTRTFYVYSYGFALNPQKTVQTLTLPRNPNVRILGVSVAR